MKTAIVLGANGFIGRATTLELSKNYYVYAFVHKTIPNFNNPNIEVIKFDIDHLFDIKLPRKIDYLFDFVWTGTSGDSRKNYQAQSKNIQDRINVVRYCSSLDCKYIGSGSIMELESIKYTFNATTTMGTNSYYSHFKYLAHSVSKAEAIELGVDYVWGRITNAYGPYEESNRLIVVTIKKLLEGTTPSFSSGLQPYDFIYISDVAKAFRYLAEKGKCNEDYVIGSGNPKTLREYLGIMNNLLSPNIAFKYGANADVSKYLEASDYSIDKLANDTGFCPNVSFEEGINTTYEWYKGEYNAKNVH